MRVCCLNFASAKNPGGGFLGGSQAQEEALARASALYPCINQCQEYYEFHRKVRTNGLYSDHMIFSPLVPVFRDDHDRLLDEPWLTSIITSPAVNAGALQKNNPELAKQVEPAMRERIRKVLKLAASFGETHLILGAWGCGVFRNDPNVVAALFDEELRSAAFCRQFASVRFSVLDTLGKQATISAFEKRFAK